MALGTKPRQLDSLRSFSGAYGTVGIQVYGDEFALLEVMESVRLEYVEIAKAEIEATFGPDPSKYQVVVDGKVGGNIYFARLNGSGIEAFQVGGIEDLKKAFNAAMQYLRSNVPAIFNRSTGYFQTSALTADFFTILVNGQEVASVNWEKVTAKSNIQVYSKARYAAPLESMKQGRILMGARNAAKNAGGQFVRASFSYRNPTKMGQVKQFSKRTGEPFTPLAVPVLQMGTAQSNVDDYVGNLSKNLQQGRKLDRPNMIQRNILPRTRWQQRRPLNRPNR